ncbi:MAG: PTS sugar transporter subunit IIA [Candidatus Orphnella occulta]|nr:PTS sugar transporter subunit IIA [Candidatus Orphnella occulta]MDP8297705.1 PTS sugar transporter subunit IIA [Candidatus Orphnella occulta]
MKMLEFLDKNAITADIVSAKKEDVITELVDLLSKVHPIKDKKSLIDTLMNREQLGSTGIGQGIGIPHAKSSVVKNLVAALGISRTGVDFDSLDGEPTYIFLLLVAPEDAAGPHLKALAKISRMLQDKFIRDSLTSAKNKDIIFDIIRQEDGKS